VSWGTFLGGKTEAQDMGLGDQSSNAHAVEKVRAACATGEKRRNEEKTGEWRRWGRLETVSLLGTTNPFRVAYARKRAAGAQL
jgi:hypothetical protein